MQIRWRESAGGRGRCVLVLVVAVAAWGVCLCVCDKLWQRVQGDFAQCSYYPYSLNRVQLPACVYVLVCTRDCIYVHGCVQVVMSVLHSFSQTWASAQQAKTTN